MIRAIPRPFSGIFTGLLILTAYAPILAQDKAAPKGLFSDPSGIFIIVSMIFIFYFFIIRPQQKAHKKAQMMIANLKKGDKVITSAGIVGIVSNVKDDTVLVKTADSTMLELTKAAIGTVLNPDGQEKKPLDQKVVADETKNGKDKKK